MKFKHFRDNFTDEKRDSFIRDYFAYKEDFKLLMTFNPYLTDYYNNKSIPDYNPVIDFIYEIVFKPTGEKVRFKIEYIKRDSVFSIICPEYEEQQIFYISEEDDIEETLSGFLRNLEEEILLKRECGR